MEGRIPRGRRLGKSRVSHRVDVRLPSQCLDWRPRSPEEDPGKLEHARAEPRTMSQRGMRRRTFWKIKKPQMRRRQGRGWAMRTPVRISEAAPEAGVRAEDGREMTSPRGGSHLPLWPPGLSTEPRGRGLAQQNGVPGLSGLEVSRAGFSWAGSGHTGPLLCTPQCLLLS